MLEKKPSKVGFFVFAISISNLNKIHEFLEELGDNLFLRIASGFIYHKANSTILSSYPYVPVVMFLPVVNKEIFSVADAVSLVQIRFFITSTFFTKNSFKFLLSVIHIIFNLCVPVFENYIKVIVVL